MGSSPKLLHSLEGVGGGQKVVKKSIQNLWSERGPLQQAGVKRKLDECTEGSVGSETKKVCWLVADNENLDILGGLFLT